MKPFEAAVEEIRKLENRIRIKIKIFVVMP